MTTTTRGRYAAPRKPRNPFYLLAALAASLLLLVGACAGTETDDDAPADFPVNAERRAGPGAETDEPTPDPVAEAEQEYEDALEDAKKAAEESAPKPEIGAVGDTATITQDWGDGAAEGTITVSAIEVTTRPYDEYGEAPKHGVFLVFTVDVTADGTFEVYDGDFYIRAPDGTRYDVGDGNSYDAADYDDQLGWIDLNAGEKKSGLLVFDVPEAVGELAYAPNYDGGPIVEWAFDEDAS